MHTLEMVKSSCSYIIMGRGEGLVMGRGKGEDNGPGAVANKQF